LSNRKNDRRGFRPPRKIEEYWNLYKKDIYVEKPDRRLPPWFLPLLTFLLIIAVIFWAAPLVLSRLQINLDQDNSNQNQVEYLYDSSYRAVSLPVADVFAAPDLKSARKAQALYNEPVRIIDDSPAWGFVEIELLDGTSGFMLLENVSSSRESIEPDLYVYQAVVASSAKRIMSHARSGTMIAEVMMGTRLFADYRGDGILRVCLPDGEYGWIGEDGVIVIGADEEITMTSDGARYYCSSAMTFHNVTVLDFGQSRTGVSCEGIARIAGIVNGINLPRDLSEQVLSGEAIELRYLEPESDDSDQNDDNESAEATSDEETAEGPPKTAQFDLSILQPADLVFVDDAANPGEAVSMAIVMENGQFLMEKPGSTAIRLVDPAQIPDWTERIIAVRRLYPEQNSAEGQEVDDIPNAS
jgi:hypothetical protein